MSPLKSVVVRTRRATIILVAAAALALPVGAYQLGQRVEGNTNLLTDNCRRIHAVVSTLDQIIINGRASALRYERDGTITSAQLRRALRDNDVARSKLYRADCPPGSAPPLK
jgi:FAD synthase